MRIYTRSGDKGETSLIHGVRVPKHAARVEAYGTCDEANSCIGLALALLPAGPEWDEVRRQLAVVQTKLFHVGAELATPPDKPVGWPIGDDDVTALERQIDALDAQLPPLANFILPGGHPAGAALHVARTVVRRAERAAVRVAAEEAINPAVVRYLNRLSDYLFVLARYVNQRLGRPEPTLHADDGT
ncbi:MAG TPA: cob(I)yrinic acid a,c-diamide adenosyltransferase [Calditerricola sp.]